MSDNLFIEPWQVEVTSDTLAFREETTVSDFVLGGAMALGVSLDVPPWLNWRNFLEESVVVEGAMLFLFLFLG